MDTALKGGSPGDSFTGVDSSEAPLSLKKSPRGTQPTYEVVYSACVINYTDMHSRRRYLSSSCLEAYSASFKVLRKRS